MLLSIIIPAYNAEKYIVGCLDSCYRWTSELPEGEREVIVVDDGSTDQTPALLRQYAQQHTDLHLMQQRNQGQSVARNLAIEHARGEYLYMVDADDAMMGPLPLDTARLLRHDIIAVQVMYRLESGRQRPWSHQMERWPFDVEFRTGAEFVRRHNIEGLVYGYLFRRSLFTAHPELRFTPGIYHQDEELIFKLFTLAGPVVYKRGYAYLYYEHSGSSLNTRTAARKRKLMDDYVVIMRNLVAWRQCHGFTDAMHFKLSYLAMDLLRMLIMRRYEPAYALAVIHEMRGLGLYPLPWLDDRRYLIMKALTCHPRLVTLWIWLNDRVHRTADR